jgi:hypothetical protein
MISVIINITADMLPVKNNAFAIYKSGGQLVNSKLIITPISAVSDIAVIRPSIINKVFMVP